MTQAARQSHEESKRNQNATHRIDWEIELLLSFAIQLKFLIMFYNVSKKQLKLAHLTRKPYYLGLVLPLYTSLKASVDEYPYCNLTLYETFSWGLNCWSVFIVYVPSIPTTDTIACLKQTGWIHEIQKVFHSLPLSGKFCLKSSLSRTKMNLHSSVLLGCYFGNCQCSEQSRAQQAANRRPKYILKADTIYIHSDV